MTYRAFWNFGRTKPQITHKHTVLTAEQKLAALSHRYYDHLTWDVTEGDYYTTCRGDLELYRVHWIREGKVHTVYCDNPDSEISTWPIEDFQDKNFGIYRVWVPPWVLGDKT